MKKLLAVAILSVFLILLISLSFVIVDNRTIIFRSRAQVATLSRQNSFTFVVPACGKAGINGQSTRLNIVALTDTGLGKENIVCKVVTDYTQKLTVKAIQAITDSYGKALFDIAGDSAGIYEVKVFCDDVLVNDRQKLCFE